MSRLRLLERALAIFGALTLLLLVVSAGYGVLLARRGFSTREEPSSVEVFFARAMRGLAIPSRVRSVINPVPATAEVLASARAHWADHCASCHANNGSGDVPLGRQMFPRPPDMRGTRTQGLSDGALYSIIKNGVRLTGMPAWGEPGGDDRASWELVTFIRHLPSLSPEEEAEMKELNPKSVHELHERQSEDEFLNAPDEEKTP